MPNRLPQSVILALGLSGCPDCGSTHLGPCLSPPAPDTDVGPCLSEEPPQPDPCLVTLPPPEPEPELGPCLSPPAEPTPPPAQVPPDASGSLLRDDSPRARVLARGVLPDDVAALLKQG